MGIYRLYFLDDDRRITAAEVVDSANDLEAITLAEQLVEACSDECSGFELWQLDRLIAKQDDLTTAPKLHPEEITAAMQESLVQREEKIRDSRWRIAKSKKLLARLAEARAKALPGASPSRTRSR